MPGASIPPQFRDNPRLLDSLWKLLMDEIGGPHMIEVLYRHHVEGYSLRKLAALEDIPVGTLRGRMDKAKSLLDRVDLWPADWKRSETPADGAADDHALHACEAVDPQRWRFSVARRRPADRFEQWLRAVALAR